MPRKELGEILREADLVSEAQLAEALSLQRTFGERLASILVRQKILTEKFAVTYLGRQLGVPGVDLSKAEIELSLQTRDAQGTPVVRRERIDPAKVGIVVVDMWNYHWCKTATMRVQKHVLRDAGITPATWDFESLGLVVARDERRS